MRQLAFQFANVLLLVGMLRLTEKLMVVVILSQVLPPEAALRAVIGAGAIVGGTFAWLRGILVRWVGDVR